MAKRIQARRKQQEAMQPQWLRHMPLAAGFAVFLGLALAAGLWLAEAENLPVRTVRVQGEMHHVTTQEVRSAVLPYAQAGFMYIDIAAARAALEQLPWVHSAQVRRTWPDLLLVQLREQQVLARWADGGLVNPEGGVFLPLEPVAAAGLPLLRGPQGTSLMLTARFIELQQALTPLQLNITEVAMDDRRAWRLVLDNGMELMLGRDEHPARMDRFVRAWPRILGPRSATVARVDLRYTNGFSVQWRQS
jgi:cell division protein FtsQ